MHLTTFLTGLVSLLSVTTAIPMGNDAPTPTTSVSKSLISPSSSSSPSSSASASASATPSPNPYEAYTCPKGKFKSCCMSVQQASGDIVKGLGEVVPLVSGLQVSSALSFKCMFSPHSFFYMTSGRLDYCILIQHTFTGKNMTEREAPDTCNGKGYSPMCCSSKNDVCISSSLAFLFRVSDLILFF